jgi:hypothetical protein
MRTLLLLLALGIFTVSCEKIVAEDITAETPVLILPAFNDTVQQNPVHFKWEAMEGSSKYHLQVVSPSFAAINQFLLDSVVTGTDFNFDLDSNEYELKLTAQNGGYESQILGPIKFWVGVQSSGGGTNNVVLISPVDQVYENGSFNDPFAWTPITGATSYEFSLREGSSFETGQVLDAQNGISTSEYTVPAGLLVEGEYFWGVKAYFGTVETPFTVNQLFIDETDPNVAILSSPNDLSLETVGLISFLWSNGTDTGTIQSPVTSTFEIATDVGFGSLVSPAVSLIGNMTDVNLTAGVYYWRVTNADEAGNSAGVSPVYQVTVTL